MKFSVIGAMFVFVCVSLLVASIAYDIQGHHLRHARHENTQLRKIAVNQRRLLKRQGHLVVRFAQTLSKTDRAFAKARRCQGGGTVQASFGTYVVIRKGPCS